MVAPQSGGSARAARTGANAPTPAHSGAGLGSGFAAGFLHPLMGWGQSRRWSPPIVFPLMMTLGGALGVLGIPLPAVEAGIALSALLLGAAVACAWRPPLWLPGAAVGLFAVFHGHAHGTELPEAAHPLVYSLGFVIATGLLHLGGIELGEAVRWRHGRTLVRAAGGLIALAGAVFLKGAL